MSTRPKRLVAGSLPLSRFLATVALLVALSTALAVPDVLERLRGAGSATAEIREYAAKSRTILLSLAIALFVLSTMVKRSPLARSRALGRLLVVGVCLVVPVLCAQRLLHGFPESRAAVDDTRRVLLLGNPVAFGFLPESEVQLLPARLEARLSAGTASTVECLYAGVGGDSPWREHEWLLREEGRNEPDLVVLGCTLDDVAEKLDLERIVHFCAERRLPLLVVSCPSSAQLSEPGLDASQPRLEASCRTWGTPFLDCLPGLRTRLAERGLGGEVVTLDAVHDTALGCELLSEVIAEHVLAEGLLPAEPR